MPLPAYDNHVHLRPDGEGVEALRRFKRAGGSGLTLVNLPYPHIAVKGAESFREGYELTLSFAEKGRREGLTVNVALGPYPLSFLKLRDALGAGRAEEEMGKALEIAADMVREGRAAAIGEVGRPHFPVDQEAVGASDRLLRKAMELAAELSCPVIIHSEAVGPKEMRSFAEMADSARLERWRAVKHLAPPLTLPEENHGVTPSIPASRKAIREAVSKGGGFLIETDFIDDPARPGAAMDIVSVPKRVKGLTQSGELSEEAVWRCCHELPLKLYGNA